MNIYEKINKIQVELKATKDNRNEFGKYNYRSAEDIYNALFEKVKKERIFPKKEIEEWCKQIKKDIDETGKFTPLFDYL